jgi:galactokinase
VISENERTRRASEALKTGDASMLGKLMNLSHASLRDDFEVSCRELDVMVDLALQQAGTFGARMMGGGFGGTTVNLVRKSTFESFSDRVAADYKLATGLDATIMMIEADSGVEEFAAVNASQAMVE